MIFFEIATILVCGALNAWGGYSWHNARRFIMPLVIGVMVSLVTQVWWYGLLALPTMGTLCIGYSKDGNFGRALWIGLQCLVLGLGLTITGHLAWYFYIPYMIGGCILGGLYRNWWQPLGDFITGNYMGLIILLVR